MIPTRDAADPTGSFKNHGIDEETTKGYKDKLGWFYSRIQK